MIDQTNKEIFAKWRRLRDERLGPACVNCRFYLSHAEAMSNISLLPKHHKKAWVEWEVQHREQFPGWCKVWSFPTTRNESCHMGEWHPDDIT